MKKSLIGTAISMAILSSAVEAKVTEATLYPNGGVLTWSEDIALDEGSNTLMISGLPLELDEQSLQASLSGLSGVSIQQVSVVNEEHEGFVSEQMAKLKADLALVQTEISLVEFEKSIEENQIQYTTKIASNPGAEVSPEDVGKVAASLREVRTNAFDKLHLIQQRHKELIAEKDALDRKINDSLRSEKTTKSVKIAYTSNATGQGKAELEFRIPTVGWKSGYNVRLDSANDVVSIEHKALIRQRSGLDWDKIDLNFSMMAPSKGAELQEATTWEVHRRKKAVSRMNGLSDHARKSNLMSAELATFTPVAEKVVNGAKTQSYKAKGKVSLASQSGEQAMVIDTHNVSTKLKTHFLPAHNDNGYIVAHGTYEGDATLPSAKVTLFRDSEMLGPWYMPEVKPGEVFEIGFGVDDRVSLKTITEKNERGTDGVIDKENTWERLNRYVVTNHHPESVDIRVIERLPVSRHEDIETVYFDLSRPYMANHNDEEGVIAWERSLEPQGEISLTAGFKIKVPEDQDI